MILDETELCFGEMDYEIRFVAFFDVLGWRNEIAAAADNSQRIARLAAALRMFSAQKGSVGGADARLMTFSDNVVFSKPYVPTEVGRLLQGLATIQLGLALMGFWMRGAVTVGRIHHDEHIVFGPALVRAHELESKFADFPRILIDDSVHLLDDLDFVDQEALTFLDPFKPSFWNRVQSALPIQQQTLDAFNALCGTAIPIVPVTVSGQTALGHIATRLSAELTVTADPKDWRKLAWLFDRVVRSLGGKTTADELPKSPLLVGALTASSAAGKEKPK